MTAREVLQELVACNDLKARAEAAVRSCSAGSHALLQEYERRKALAWKAARAYLAQPEPQDEARDAARYRWLRAEIHSVGRADIYILRNDGDWSDASQINSAYHLDDVVDAAIAAQDKESAK